MTTTDIQILKGVRQGCMLQNMQPFNLFINCALTVTLQSTRRTSSLIFSRQSYHRQVLYLQQHFNDAVHHYLLPYFKTPLYIGCWIQSNKPNPKCNNEPGKYLLELVDKTAKLQKKPLYFCKACTCNPRLVFPMNCITEYSAILYCTALSCTILYKTL